jgi:hypothetical protein
MNAEQIVRALKSIAKNCDGSHSCWHSPTLRKAVDLIESLQAQLSGISEQLSASQRRADAAVEDIYKMTDGECDVCKHYNTDKNTCAKPFVPYDACFEWRGPDEKGETG